MSKNLSNDPTEANDGLYGDILAVFCFNVKVIQDNDEIKVDILKYCWLKLQKKEVRIWKPLKDVIRAELYAVTQVFAISFNI